jgi:CRP-like cAMP-binding protein
MLTFEEAKDFAATHGWLAMTSQDFRRAVLDRATPQAFRFGETVYSIGDPPGGLYGLVAGTFKISLAPGDDGPFPGHILTPGRWTGYGPAITGGSRIIGVDAGRNCQALFLPLHSLNEMLARDPVWWRYLALLALLDTQLATGGLDDLVIRDEYRRFLAVLLRNGGCRYGFSAIDKPVWIDINQTELAFMCNLSRTTAGGFLRRLEAQGHIEIGYGQIGILAPQALLAQLALKE